MNKSYITSINSKKYFDLDFTNHFKQSDGNAQTIFFCNIALENFPKWLTEDLKNGLSLLDVGCAMGECVNIFQRKFKKSKVVGVDFSEVAIKEARINFPRNTFYCESLTSLSQDYDAIFTSNTLEHFNDPLSKLKKLTKSAKKYVIVLVPFQEYERTASHLYTFDYKTFPLNIEDFSLSFCKVITTWSMKNNHWPGTPNWPGKQILLIYARNLLIRSKKIALDSIYTEDKVAELNLHIQKIHQGRVWKIAMLYYRIRDALIDLLDITRKI